MSKHDFGFNPNGRGKDMPPQPPPMEMTLAQPLSPEIALALMAAALPEPIVEEGGNADNARVLRAISLFTNAYYRVARGDLQGHVERANAQIQQERQATLAAQATARAAAEARQKEIDEEEKRARDDYRRKREAERTGLVTEGGDPIARQSGSGEIPDGAAEPQADGGGA